MFVDITQIRGCIRIICNGNVIQAKCGFHFVLSNRWNETNEKFSIYTTCHLSVCQTKHKRIRIPFTTTRRIPLDVATPKINSVRFALTNGQRLTNGHHTYRMKPICVNAISTTSINKKCPLVTLGLQLTLNLISSFTCCVIHQKSRTFFIE